MEIVLTIPVAKPAAIECVRVDQISWQPGRKRIAIRLSLGYYSGPAWVETSDQPIVIENTPASFEGGAEGTEYDMFVKQVESANLKLLPIDRLLLQKCLDKELYKGVIR